MKASLTAFDETYNTRFELVRSKMVRLIPLTGVLVGLCSAVLADTENPIVARLIADYRTTCEAELQIEDMRDPTPPPDVDEVF